MFFFRLLEYYFLQIFGTLEVVIVRFGIKTCFSFCAIEIGFPVSYSSVRNFVHSHNSFSPQLKEEIGRYAAQCGIDATQKLYATKLSRPLSVALIRKFRRMYLRVTTGNQAAIQGYLYRNFVAFILMHLLLELFG